MLDELNQLEETLAALPKGSVCRKMIRGKECFYGKPNPRICSVYGLRRTGKTTLLHQRIGSMSPDDFKRAAYVKARTADTMAMLDKDMKALHAQGFQYKFFRRF